MRMMWSVTVFLCLQAQFLPAQPQFDAMKAAMHRVFTTYKVDVDWDAHTGNDTYTYKVTSRTSVPICDFRITWPANSTGNTGSDLTGIVAPPGWKIDTTNPKAVYFYTTDNCISQDQSVPFAFDMTTAHSSPYGRADTEVSEATGGQHKTLETNSGVFAPVLDVVPAPNSSSGTYTLSAPTAVVTGQVVTVQTRDSSGNPVPALLEIGGTRIASGPTGYATYLVPQNSQNVTVSLVGSPSPVTASVPVVPAPAGATTAPAISASTSYVSPGGTVNITGAGFSGVAPQNGVQIGGRSLPVLASSPVSLVAAVPTDMPVGDSGPLTVETVQGTARSQPRKITVVRIRVEGNNKTLLRGQKGQAQLTVEGTRQSVVLRITNLAPAVIQLAGGQAQMTAKTSGGASNTVKLKYVAVGPGNFELKSEIVEPSKPGR